VKTIFCRDFTKTHPEKERENVSEIRHVTSRYESNLSDAQLEKLRATFPQSLVTDDGIT
jgi:hypothetical protein